MQRHFLGLIALGLFLIAAIVHLIPPLETYFAAGDVCLRLGLILGAFWLAWPDLHRLPSWAWYILPLGIVALFFARNILIVLGPTAGVAIVAYLIYRKMRRPSR